MTTDPPVGARPVGASNDPMLQGAARGSASLRCRPCYRVDVHPRRRAPVLRALWLWVLVVVFVGGACQPATTAKISIYTDIPSAPGTRVAVWAGADGSSAQGSTAVTDGIDQWTEDGLVGSLVFVPPAGRTSAKLALRVVLAQGRTPDSCVATDLAGCIVATRTLTYRAQERVNLPIGLFRACLGVRCDEGTTCNSLGKCVPDFVESESCTGDSGCILQGDPPSPPGVSRPQPPAPAPSVPDAGAEAGTAGTPKAPVASYLDADVRRGLTSGVLRLSPAAGDDPPDAYVVAFSDGAQARSVIRTWTASSGAAQIPFLPGSIVPPGLDFFDVRAVRGGVESPPVLLRADNYPRVVDVTASAGIDTITSPSVFVDVAKKRTIFVGTSADRRPTARVCNMEGGSCVAVPIDAKLGPDSAALYGFGIIFRAKTSSAFDAPSRTLFVATRSSGAARGVRLIQCNVDTWSCTERFVTDLVADGVGDLPNDGLLHLDAANGRVLLLSVQVDPQSSAQITSLWSCPVTAGAKCSLAAVLPKGLSETTPGPNYHPFLNDAGGPRLLALFSTANGNAPELVVLDCERSTLTCSTRAIPGIAIDRPSWWRAPLGRIRILGAGASNSVVAYDCDDTLTACSSKKFSGAGILEEPVAIGTTASGAVLMAGLRKSVGPMLLTCDYETASCTGNVLPLTSVEHSCSSTEAGQTRICGTAQGVRTVATCQPDGAGCVVSEVAADSEREGAADRVDALLDEVQGRIVAVSRNPTRQNKATLFVCDALGKNCTNRDASDGATNQGTSEPQVALAPFPGPLFVSGVSPNGPPTLTVCERDGRNCTTRELSGGPAEPMLLPTLLIDEKNQKLLVVAFTDLAAHLFRCNLDGNACAYVSLGALPQDEIGSLGVPSVRLLPGTDGPGSDGLFVALTTKTLQCKPDGSSCVLRSVPSAEGAFPAEPDESRNAMFVVEPSESLVRECKLDGTACVAQPLDAVPLLGNAHWHSARYDAAFGALYLGQADSLTMYLHRCTRSGGSWVCTELLRTPIMRSSPFPAIRTRLTLRLDPKSHVLVAAVADRRRRPIVVLLDRF